MNGVIRSWLCLNGRCNSEFTAWESYPSCPKCRCVRVQWIPGGGHVAGTAPAADAELRKLADNHGLSDLNSARRGERAKPALPVVTGQAGGAMQFAPGYSQVPYVRDKAGHVHGVCAPSMNRVDFKTKVSANTALPASNAGFAHPSTNTRIEGVHRAPR